MTHLISTEPYPAFLFPCGGQQEHVAEVDEKTIYAAVNGVNVEGYLRIAVEEGP